MGLSGCICPYVCIYLLRDCYLLLCGLNAETRRVLRAQSFMIECSVAQAQDEAERVRLQKLIAEVDQGQIRAVRASGIERHLGGLAWIAAAANLADNLHLVTLKTRDESLLSRILYAMRAEVQADSGSSPGLASH